MMQYILNNKKIIPIFFGISAVVGIFTIYYIKRKRRIESRVDKKSSSTNGSSRTSQAPEKKQLKQSIQTYEQKFIRVINQIREVLDMNGNQLKPQVMEVIIRGQYELAKKDMEALYFLSRKQRRQKMSNLCQYIKLISKSNQEQQQLQEKHLGSLLSWFNIDIKTWNQAQLKIQKIKVQGSTYSNLIQVQQQKQFQSYHKLTIQPKPFLQLQKLLTFKLQTLKTFNIKQLSKYITDAYIMYTVIQTNLKDLTAIKFNIEQEDLLFSIGQLNEAQKEEISQMEENITQNITDLVNIINQQTNQNDYY